MYAGDLNAIQDAAAALVDLAQIFKAGEVHIGASGLAFTKTATGEVTLAGMLALTDLLKPAAALVPANMDTTTRDAIAAAKAPKGSVIYNTTLDRIEVNKGTDGSRSWQAAGASLAGRTVILNGTTSYATPAGVVAINIQGSAAGGGGGGCAQTGTNDGMAGGAGSGGYFTKLIVSPSGTYTVAVGAKGTGGAAGNNAGTDGGNTTFANGATTYTANGGKGAPGTVANAHSLGGAGGAISTNADVNVAGTPGMPSNKQGWSGNGAPGPWGGGALGRMTDGTGTAGAGFGSGGAGGYAGSTIANRGGGDGVNGVLAIDEYK